MRYQEYHNDKIIAFIIRSLAFTGSQVWSDHQRNLNWIQVVYNVWSKSAEEFGGKKIYPGLGGLSSDSPPTLVIDPQPLLAYAFFCVYISPWSLGVCSVVCIPRAGAWSLLCPSQYAFVLPNKDRRTWLQQLSGRLCRLCSTWLWTSCLHLGAAKLYLTELSHCSLCGRGRTCGPCTALWKYSLFIRNNWSSQFLSRLMPGRLHWSTGNRLVSGIRSDSCNCIPHPADL